MSAYDPKRTLFKTVFHHLKYFLLLWPCSVIAEVSDKIILPPTMAIYAVVLSIIALFANYRWVMFFPLIALITIGLASGGISVVFDEQIGSAAIKEQGESYQYYAYAEILVVVFANIAGVIFGAKNRKKI